jgi:hypothetical protein
MQSLKFLTSIGMTMGGGAGFTGPNYREDPLSPVRSLGLIPPTTEKKHILYHCRGHNTLYVTGLILQFPRLEVMFEIYNIPAGYCKFQTSRRDVVKWKQSLSCVWKSPSSHPTRCLCHLMGQKSLRPL